MWAQSSQVSIELIKAKNPNCRRTIPLDNPIRPIAIWYFYQLDSRQACFLLCFEIIANFVQDRASATSATFLVATQVSLTLLMNVTAKVIQRIEQIQGIILLNYKHYDFQPWHGTLLTWAVMDLTWH